MDAMTASDWLTLLALGGLVGLLGQGVRAIGGLKKVHDQSSQQGLDFADMFDGNQLLVSLLIGFIAGALAMVGLVASKDVGHGVAIEGKTILALLAAGYAGADFIEAFMKKYLPGNGNGQPKAAPAKASAGLVGGPPAPAAPKI